MNIQDERVQNRFGQLGNELKATDEVPKLIVSIWTAVSDVSKMLGINGSQKGREQYHEGQ